MGISQLPKKGDAETRTLSKPVVWGARKWALEPPFHEGRLYYTV